MAPPARARLALALVLVAAALAGCTTDTQPICRPSEKPADGSGVCFTTRDGWILQGHEFNPNATGEPSVLLVHGLDEQHGRYHELAGRLAEDGWHVLAMDLRGHGDSTQMANGRERTAASFTNADLYRALADLNASQRYLGEAPTFVVGASVGANMALVHAASNPGVAGIVLLSPSMGQGALSAEEPNGAYEGAIYYMASREDRRASGAVERLSGNHSGPHEVQLWTGKGHGTQMLDEESIDELDGWLEVQANETAG